MPARAATQDPAPKTREQIAKELAEARESIEGLHAKLRIAERKLEATHLDGEIVASKNRADLFTKRQALMDARSALKHFDELDRPVKIQAAEISRDQSKYSAEHSQAELAELEAMYEAEEFAKMTKELVLRRGRRNLELALRRLEVETQKLRGLNVELDREHEKLAAAVESAEMAMHTAELSARKAEMQHRIAVEEAEVGIQQLRRDLDKAKREQAELEKKMARTSGDGAHEDGGRGR